MPAIFILHGHKPAPVCLSANRCRPSSNALAVMSPFENRRSMTREIVSTSRCARACRCRCWGCSVRVAAQVDSGALRRVLAALVRR